MPINGIVPPVPMYIDGLPKNASDPLCIDASSQSATGGALQPAMDESASNVTVHSGGMSVSNISLTAVAALAASQVGGSRKDNFRVVKGNCTLPALTSSGRPSAPVTLNAGRQVLFNSNSYGDSVGDGSLTAHGYFL